MGLQAFPSTQSPGRHLLLIALPGTAQLQQEPGEQRNFACSGPSGNGRCGGVRIPQW